MFQKLCERTLKSTNIQAKNDVLNFKDYQKNENMPSALDM
jgi:hypothetical protein